MVMLRPSLTSTQWQPAGNTAREALPCQKGHQETTSNSSMFVWETKYWVLQWTPWFLSHAADWDWKVSLSIPRDHRICLVYLFGSFYTPIKVSVPFCPQHSIFSPVRTRRPKLFFCLTSFPNNLSGSPSALPSHHIPSETTSLPSKSNCIRLQHNHQA